ncbi:MAG: hypothetical protein AAFY28_00425 [Actinomycetota bacterium]
MKPRRLAAIVALSVVAVGCVSDPSANRVAQDLINTLATTEEERECMLEVLEGYDNIDDLGNDANSDTPAVAEAANEELDRFQADLEACRIAG